MQTSRVSSLNPLLLIHVIHPVVKHLHTSDTAVIHVTEKSKHCSCFTAGVLTSI